MKRRDLIKLFEKTDGTTKGMAEIMTSTLTERIANQFHGKPKSKNT